MIRMHQHVNSDTVKEYFRTELAISDYYIDGQEMTGVFLGKFADHLGLKGDVSQKVFENLCDNINPITKKRLTQRNAKNRTIGYDINFHCPKSVSILYGLTGDDRILEAFRRSVRRTMEDIEKDMQVRIRVKGQYDDRVVGNLIWGEFIHTTSRPVIEYLPDEQIHDLCRDHLKNIDPKSKEYKEKFNQLREEKAIRHAPDPHLHAHCFTFNAVYDAIEDKVKAGQFKAINRDMPFYQSSFHTYFADDLTAMGLDLHKTKTAFDLDIVPTKAIEFMSKRTNEIGKVARDQGLTNAKAIDKLGAKTRAVKQKGLTMPQLRKKWKESLIEAGLGKGTTDKNETPMAKTVTVEQCLDYAVKHSFESKSTVSKRIILAHALHFAVDNKDITVEAINKQFDLDKRILSVEKTRGQNMCTVKEVFQEEKRMVDLARDGRNSCRPLALDRVAHIGQLSQMPLDDYQKHALKSIMSLPDRIMLIGGSAGAGKTAMTIEAKKHFEASGHEVVFFAPTITASRDTMRELGLEKADTVQKLLLSPSLQDSIKDKVVWIDEGGMLSTKDCANLVQLIHDKNARCIVSGDIKQHGSAKRGNGLKVWRDQAKLPYPTLKGIYRQQQKEAKEVVSLIRDGHISTAYDKLDALGAIKEKPWEMASKELVNDYVDALKKKQIPLIIVPTNEQCDELTRVIRNKLKETGEITGKDRQVRRLKNRQLDDPQKKDHRNYRVGDVVQNHFMPQVDRGAKLTVTAFDKDRVIVQHEGENKTVFALPVNKPHQFSVYRDLKIPLAKGDIIKRTKSGTDKHNNRLDNGQILVVDGFTRDGHIKAKNWSKTPKSTTVDYLLDKKDGNINHAQAITSQSAQSKTVDLVLAFQPSATFTGSSNTQFYTTITRARLLAKIYTDNKEGLKEAIQKGTQELSAMELVDIYKKRQQEKSLEAVRLTQSDKDYVPDPPEVPTPEPPPSIHKIDPPDFMP